MDSTADVVHLDLLALRIFFLKFTAQLAVAIGTPQPSRSNNPQQFRIVGAVAQGGAQIDPVSREQAGVELAFGGEAGAGARAPKRGRPRRDENPLAPPPIQTPTPPPL